jgi:hypothetical protein
LRLRFLDRLGRVVVVVIVVHGILLVVVVQVGIEPVLDAFGRAADVGLVLVQDVLVKGSDPAGATRLTAGRPRRGLGLAQHPIGGNSRHGKVGAARHGRGRMGATRVGGHTSR